MSRQAIQKVVVPIRGAIGTWDGSIQRSTAAAAAAACWWLYLVHGAAVTLLTRLTVAHTTLPTGVTSRWGQHRANTRTPLQRRALVVVVVVVR